MNPIIGVFLIKSMRIIVNESILQEGYPEIQELNAIANEIILEFARLNSYLIPHLLDKEINYDSIVLEEDFTHTGEIKGEFPKLQKFLDKPIIIVFVTNIPNKLGSYESGRVQKVIRINNHNDIFLEELKDTIVDVKNYLGEHGGELNRNESEDLLGRCLRVAFKSTLVHELRHAYDDFISNSKFITDKKSKKYYEKYGDNGENEKMSPEQRQIYLTLPHEYWVRFTQAVLGVSIWDDFDKVKKVFIRLIKGWDLLSLKHQKRLLKALWLYYQGKKENNN